MHRDVMRTSQTAQMSQSNPKTQPALFYLTTSTTSRPEIHLKCGPTHRSTTRRFEISDSTMRRLLLLTSPRKFGRMPVDPPRLARDRKRPATSVQQDTHANLFATQNIEPEDRAKSRADHVTSVRYTTKNLTLRRTSLSNMSGMNNNHICVFGNPKKRKWAFCGVPTTSPKPI